MELNAKSFLHIPCARQRQASVGTILQNTWLNLHQTLYISMQQMW